jgi:hypothetical protein
MEYPHAIVDQVRDRVDAAGQGELREQYADWEKAR